MLAYFSESSPAVVSSRPYFLPQRILSVATETMLGLGGGRSPSNWTEVLRSDFSMLRKEPIDDVSFASTTHFAYGLIVAVIATIILVLVLLKSNATITKYASSSLQSQAFNLQEKASNGLESHTYPAPPVVHIPREEQLSERGHAAYARALEENGGDVVVIPRHGRMEYVIDHRHVRDVLTDANSYSFEKAVTNMLHMEFMLWFKNGTFVQELDKLVQDGVTPRLRAVVEKVAPIFARESAVLAEQNQDEIRDVYTWVHRAVAQAMVVLILGESYLNTEMTEHFMAITVAIANLSGIYENTEGWCNFPKLWSLKTTLVAIFGTVVPHFFCGVLPCLWRNRQAHLEHGVDVEHNEYAPFFDLLAAKHRNRATGKLSVLNFVWCATVCLGIIFASIHQTAVVAVWCIMTLCQRQDDYLDALRTEWSENVDIDSEGRPSLTVESLKHLTLLDSFIRETMRTKSDTFAPVRYTTCDVRVGKYIIPKNSLCAPYVKRAHEHPANYGPDGTRFDGFQWHQKGRPAVQGNHDFISFGLGRWACPGRHLAIAEIKMILVTLFANYDVQLQPGSFRVADPMNATSVAPEGVLRVVPHCAA